MMRPGPDERGATMVEAAIALPLVTLLVFGLIDAGALFRSYLTVRYVSNTAARTAVVDADSAVADYHILAAVNKHTAALDTGSLERVVVFKATSFDDAVPADCMSGTTGVTGKCNVYLPADFGRPITDFGGTGPWSGDQWWPAWQRQTSRSAGTDLVGVTVKARARTFSGVLGQNDREIVRTRIMRVEPRQP